MRKFYKNLINFAIENDVRYITASKVSILYGKGRKRIHLKKSYTVNGVQYNIYFVPKYIVPKGYKSVIYHPEQDNEPIRFDTLVPFFNSGIEGTVYKENFENIVEHNIQVLNKQYLSRISIDTEDKSNENK